MNEQNAHEIWQVEVGGQIYEAPFAELGDWIDGGSLHPGDKVRKGNLRWIEAGKVPSLTPFFNAKQKGLPMPVVVTTTDATPITEPLSDTATPFASTSFNSDFEPSSSPVYQAQSSPSDPNFCTVHNDAPSKYLCDGCGNGFCKVCPKSYGGSVKICPMCGAMCRSAEEVQQRQAKENRYSSAMSEGFGMGDFFNAVGHPFKFKSSLFFGAVMFMLFSLGQSAASMGSMFLVASGLICFMLSNMLTFGVLTNTIDNFSQGKLDENFMPSYDDFSLWDDVLHPFFLCIGVYISSFGPFLVVFLVGMYLIVSTFTAQANSHQAQLETLPGTPYYTARDTAKQSEDVKKVLGEIDKKNHERVAAHQDYVQRQSDVAEGLTMPSEEDSMDSPPVPYDPADTEKSVMEAQGLIDQMNQHRAKELETVVGKTSETKQREFQQMITGFLALAAPLVVIGFITFVWGAFYFPAACAVAGYTKSFAATLNPIVGLDTIKRLGLSYVKILLMAFMILVATSFIGGVAAVILSPFDLPGLGNLPANAITALFAFYFSVVFSCILGYALFKSSDKLQLLR